MKVVTYEYDGGKKKKFMKKSKKKKQEKDLVDKPEEK